MVKLERATLTLPGDLKRTARAKAIKDKSTLSAVVRQLLELWLAGKIDLPAQEQETE